MPKRTRSPPILAPPKLLSTERQQSVKTESYRRRRNAVCEDKMSSRRAAPEPP
jgi:hypothetical protein